MTAITACLQHLRDEKPLRSLQLPEPEAKAIASFGLMTAKPILYVANVDETDILGTSPLVTKVREFATKAGANIVPVCAKLEAEIAELDEPDRSEMLHGVGLTEPALATVARETYRTWGCRATSPQAKKRCAPGQFPSVPRLLKPQESSIATWRKASFAQKFIRSRISKLTKVKKRFVRPENCARKARPTLCKTATSATSSPIREPKLGWLVAGCVAPSATQAVYH